ncbi:MAG: phosphoglucosamine mutase [Promethearchaeota archaeon CR_4]|nr:MAG: phosphoglucosamine mutase [Candidatus Lokiarchaeota archaeon CR_4]
MADIPEYPYTTSEVRIPDGQMLDGSRWDDLKQKIIAVYQEKMKKNLRVTEIDGVRFDCSYGWVLIRQSGTTPLVRIAVESREGVQQANQMMEEAKKLLGEFLHA